MTSYTSGVGVAQLAEHWIVAPVVAGSNPVAHPPMSRTCQDLLLVREDELSQARDQIHGFVIQRLEEYDVLILVYTVPLHD